MTAILQEPMALAWKNTHVYWHDKEGVVLVAEDLGLHARFMLIMTTRQDMSEGFYAQHATLHSVNLKTRQKSLPLSAVICSAPRHTKSYNDIKLLW